jgi:hypothetical protein
MCHEDIRTQNVFDATSNKQLKYTPKSRKHLLTPIFLEVEKYTFSTIMMNACYRNVLAVLVVAVTTPAILTTSAFQSSSQFLGNHPRYFNTRVRGGNSDTALCMKTIAVFGASGLTASECVYQALKNGDTVVGLTRYLTILHTVT